MTLPGDQLRRRRAEAAERRDLVARRRALAFAGVALLVAAGVFALTRGGGEAGNGVQSDPHADGTTAPSCPAHIAANPRRLAGQMLIVRMEATATDSLRARVGNGTIGGVVLFPPPGTRPTALGAQIAALRQAAADRGAPAPLVAIDQEGGEVKRLASLPPDLAPGEIAARGEAAAREQGLATGKALRLLGIDVDLAPVLDVPAVEGASIASRSLGEDPARAGALGLAFGAALQQQGVAATAKHFPGLGLATQNTDLLPTSIDAGRAELDRGLAPFRTAIGGGFDLVMVSNATYPTLDSEHPASQSSRVIAGLLRRDLGYDGVAITDDLGAGAITAAGIDEGEAAVGAADAGADLLLFALSQGEQAGDALVTAIRSGELSRGALLASCARTTALRLRLAG